MNICSGSVCLVGKRKCVRVPHASTISCQQAPGGAVNESVVIAHHASEHTVLQERLREDRQFLCFARREENVSISAP